MKVLLQDERWYKHPTFLLPAFTLAIFSALLVSSVLWWKQAYANKIANGVVIDYIPVGGLTRQEALVTLHSLYQPSNTTITLIAEGQQISSSSAQLNIFKPYESVVESAYRIGRSESFIKNISQLLALGVQNENIGVEERFETQKVVELVRLLALSSDTPSEMPAATIAQEGLVVISPGKMGSSINIPNTVEEIQKNDASQNITLSVHLDKQGRVLTESEIASAIGRASSFLNSQVIFQNGTKKTTLTDLQIIPLLSFPQGFVDEKIDSTLIQVEKEFTTQPSDAKFSFDPKTLKVDVFQPEVIGTKVDSVDFRSLFLDSLNQIPQSGDKHLTIKVPLTEYTPEISLKDTNNLGINERIGFGESYYDHSIASRIHNVTTSNKILNNTIVPPGEEFSFNKAIGEVSQRTGFQQAYVIRSGATVLGDGGGVCQVSTTLFRALLDSGINITKRKAHSYRVSYYELNQEPGFDATVYSGDVDLRFINDTSHHILLTFQDNPQQKYMTVNIYGTSDGRSTEISNYQKWGYQNPPPAQYTDDPSLPVGKTIQIDWAVAGIKAKFTHTVKDKEGKVLYENEYYSNYIPWSAKYRRGIGA